MIKLNHISKNGNTALILAIRRKMEEVALKILDYPEKCNLDYIDKYGGTALLWAICKRMKEVALKILNYPKKCNLDYIDQNGNTALIFAIKNKMKEVALRILDYPNRCKLGHINNRDTSLTWACKYEMKKVALKILNYPDLCDIHHINNDNLTALQIAFKYNLKIVVNNIEKKYLKEELDGQYECIFCCKKTNKCILFSNCKHSFVSCICCKYKLLSKCPSCRNKGKCIDVDYETAKKSENYFCDSLC